MTESNTNHVHYALRVLERGEDELVVTAFEGQEGLSSCFQFDVHVSGPPELAAELLGHSAIFDWSLDGKVRRRIGGVIARSNAIRRSQYQIRLAPTLWCLTLTRRSRIFQDMTSQEVLKKVLNEGGVECTFRLARRYPKRTYCTQYEETDYEFVKRLAAENGWFFFFDRGQHEAVTSLDAMDRVVFADDPSGYRTQPIEGRLRFLQTSGAGAGTRAYDEVTEFDLTHRLRPQKVTHREYDPSRPATMLESSDTRDSSAAKLVAARRAAFIKLNAGPVAELGEPKSDGGEYYEHHARHLHPDWDFEKTQATRMLSQLRRDHVQGRGASHCPQMFPGGKFELVEHFDEAQNGEYVVVEMTHKGVAPGADVGAVDYSNSFKVVPADVSFPLPVARRRNVVSNVTATVVSETGDPAYSRGMAEVKVQFHWERDNDADDQSGTCWIRCMNSWAGTHWGTQFIPRPGMEVVVGFEGGDPDKPFVLGSLYNRSHPPPFPLPGERLRSGIRTHGTSGGFNELSFDDVEGNERIHIRAERDLVTEVLQDTRHSTNRNDYLSIAGNQSIAVAGELATRVGGESVLEVASNYAVNVAGNELVSIQGESERHVFGRQHLAIDGQSKTRITGDMHVECAADAALKVNGSRTVVVGSHDAARTHSLHVEGVNALYGSNRVEIQSEREIILRCGSSVLRITPKAIEVDAETVKMRGTNSTLGIAEDQIQLGTGATLALLESERVFLGTSGSSLAMRDEVKIDGTQILLNSPDLATDPVPDERGQPTEIEVVDKAGRPVPNQRYILRLEDDSELSGVTDREGRAVIFLRQGGTVTFPELAEVTPKTLPTESE